MDPWNEARRLGECVQALYPYGELPGLPLTSLKLQKLCFYAAGVSWSNGVGEEFGSITFEAWKHGPVLRALHRATLPKVTPSEHLGPATLACVKDAVDVYGLISAWGLREQSHLEAPWKEAHANDVPGKPATLPKARIVEHFREKFGTRATFPEYFANRGVFTLDGLHYDPTFDGFPALATFVREAFRDALPPVR